MNSEAIVRWLESFGQLDAAAAAVLAAVFVVAAFVPMPRTFLVLGSGAAFGLQALWVIVPSTTLGCVLAFSAGARSVARLSRPRPARSRCGACWPRPSTTRAGGSQP